MPGFAPGEPERFHNDVWWSEDGKDWTRLREHAPWAPRGMVGNCCVLHDRIWLLGGGTYDTPTTPDRMRCSEVWSTKNGVGWEYHGDAPWAPRLYHEVSAFDGRMCVMEGTGAPGQNRNDVWFSEDGLEWRELPDTPWKPRHAASVCVFDEGLWVVAGNNMEPDAWKLTRA